MNELEILKAARHVISRPEKWTKFTRNSRDGAHCALGALDAVAGKEQPCGIYIEGQTIERLGAVLTIEERTRRAVDGQCYLGVMGIVAQFNNAPATTHADVLSMFDRAIAQLEPSKTDISIFTAMLTPKRESVPSD